MPKGKLPGFVLLLGAIIPLVATSGCVPAGESEQGGGMNNITLIIFLVLIVAMLYFTMIRPQRKQQKERRELMAQLQRGDKVITSSGIYGEIESINANSVVLKIESGATIRMHKSSIMGKRQ